MLLLTIHTLLSLNTIQPDLDYTNEGLYLPIENKLISSRCFQSGTASHYGSNDGFNGQQTSSGEIFNHNFFTAAHRTLNFGTRVKVTNTANNRSVIVRINDRGPFYSNRIIDLSTASFRSIGNLNQGLINVCLEVLN